jgi:putative hydrolase of the HAD superfamily
VTSDEPRPIEHPDIQAVVFDWYATLARPFDDGWWSQLRSLIASGGGTVDDEAIAAWEAMPTDHVAFSESKESYEAWSIDRFRHLLSACGVPDRALDGVVDASEALRSSEQITVIDGAIEVVERLRSGGLAVAVCSNWDWDLDRHLVANGIEAHFDLVVCSASAGYRKPHGAIFDRVTAGLGVEPASVVFVGDDIGADIGGAIAAGMHPVHAGWSIACGGGHGEDVPCCARVDELISLPLVARALTARSRTVGNEIP